MVRAQTVCRIWFWFQGLVKWFTVRPLGWAQQVLNLPVDLPDPTVFFSWKFDQWNL